MNNPRRLQAQVNLRQTIRHTEDLFNSHCIEDAHLEAELMIMHALGIGRVELYTRMEDSLHISQDFWHLVERRLSHEPTAYILERREFYGLNFYVDSNVLIPRPESELLVEKALTFSSRWPLSNNCMIADIGTGSGAIAISLALHLPHAVIHAIDISQEALRVTTLNCKKHGVEDRIHITSGDTLEPLDTPVDMIVANLPYVRSSDFCHLSPEIREHEPRVALDGGEDGLDKIRKLFSQAPMRLRPGGLMLCEIGQGQNDPAIALAKTHFPNARVDVIRDLGGIDRIVQVATAVDSCTRCL